MDLGGQGETVAKANTVRRSSATEQLRQKKLRLEEELQEVNQAIAALDSNPELERVLHLVSKAMRY